MGFIIIHLTLCFPFPADVKHFIIILFENGLTENVRSLILYSKVV